ncbi:MAG: cell wall metabolism sensor histidine kinase WalK, partial [candidate division KSB1 bacterium]|nr:cell wall metabolism sensor histidine kinase WalK [candidate division KSB1 bacterium]
RAIKQEVVVRPPAEKVVMANTTPIRDPSGETIGLISVIRDITELKKIDIMRSQFVNMAAHELKAPLTAVQGYLELLLDKSLGDSPELYEQYLRRSLERTRELVNLINDLLNISRMEAGKIRREIQTFRLDELLRDRLEFFREEIERRSITVSQDLQPVAVDADREEIARLFNQLLSNAVKYNRQGGSIVVTLKRSGNYAAVAIRDTGIGMTPEEKSRLFEEFFRAKNEFTRNITGTGLGLIVAKKIVDAYAGMIEVESEFQVGSTFTVLLPLSQQNETIQEQGNRA